VDGILDFLKGPRKKREPAMKAGPLLKDERKKI
jgi:hypothetical protein